MAFELLHGLKSIISTNDLSGYATAARQQFYFVKIDTNGQIIVGTAGGYCIGVVQDNPPALSPGQVCGPGSITKVYCGGSFAAGQNVMSNSTGQCVAATSGSQILGVALTAGVNAYLATILYQPMGKM